MEFFNAVAETGDAEFEAVDLAAEAFDGEIAGVERFGGAGRGFGVLHFFDDGGIWRTKVMDSWLMWA